MTYHIVGVKHMEYKTQLIVAMCRWRPVDTESGMALIEVSMLSGFEADRAVMSEVSIISCISRVTHG